MTKRAVIPVVLVVVLLVGAAVGITYYATSGGSSRSGIVTRNVDLTCASPCGDAEDRDATNEARYVCGNTHASSVEVFVHAQVETPQTTATDERGVIYGATVHLRTLHYTKSCQ